MSLVKKPEMTEKKVAANRRNQNLCYERQMEAPEKTGALHDVLETKWVSSLAPECQEPLSQSN
jgi:hypothetical protein